MEMERRGSSNLVLSWSTEREEPIIGLSEVSRMNREIHVRFDEGLGVRFPGATLQ